MKKPIDESLAFRRWVALAILCSLPIPLTFALFGQNPRGETAWFCTLMILVAIRIRWDYRHYPWLWITVVIAIALHIPLIVFFPWSKTDYPGLSLMPVGLLDCGIIYGLFTLVGKIMLRDKTPVE